MCQMPPNSIQGMIVSITSFTHSTILIELRLLQNIMLRSTVFPPPSGGGCGITTFIAKIEFVASTEIATKKGGLIPLVVYIAARS